MERKEREIMELKRENMKLRFRLNTFKKAAFEDELTKVFNRRFFNIKYEQMMGKCGSLIMLDVDYFKNVNDRFGHLQADHILLKVAEVIKNNVRSTDIVARWGGEEFMVLLPETDKRTALNIACRISKRIKEETPVTVSIGVVTAFDLNRKQEMLDRVDDALYESKKAGRDRVTAVLC